MLLEPIQGEAGVLVPPPGYLSAARVLCTERNVLLVLDEIQSGLGRTGETFAWQQEGAKPDLMVLGQGARRRDRAGQRRGRPRDSAGRAASR